MWKRLSSNPTDDGPWSKVDRCCPETSNSSSTHETPNHQRRSRLAGDPNRRHVFRVAGVIRTRRLHLYRTSSDHGGTSRNSRVAQPHAFMGVGLAESLRVYHSWLRRHLSIAIRIDSPPFDLRRATRAASVSDGARITGIASGVGLNDRAALQASDQKGCGTQGGAALARAGIGRAVGP